MTSPHLLDRTFAWASRSAPSFGEGYGDEGILREFEARAFEAHFAAMLRAPCEPRFEGSRRSRVWPGARTRDGRFASPLEGLPSPVAQAHVREVTAPSASRRGAFVVLAASREEGYRARELVWSPLAREGYAIYLLENPYYGARRAAHQTSASLPTVAEQLAMNVASVLEAGALLEWLEHAHPGVPRGVVGYSMGGHMAALTASLYPKEIFTCALACGAAAAPIFLDGLLSRSVDFRTISRERLRDVMARADLVRAPLPRRCDAVVLVAATRDGFVSPAEVERLHAHWVGSRLVWKDAGHVSLILRHHGSLRAAVREAAGVLRA